jgi:hypothetical protein
MGFEFKHDSGALRFYGSSLAPYTAWTALEGPLIGFQYKGSYSNMSVIVGDGCKPKFFGVRQLSVKLGEKRQVQFKWQETD